MRARRVAWIALAALGTGFAAVMVLAPDASQPTAPGAEARGAPPDALHPTLAAAPIAPGRVEGGSLPFASGIVVDPEGRAVSGARILARTRIDIGGRPQETWVASDAAPIARTDEAGRFRVETAPADLVSLVALADGFAAQERRDLSADPAANQDLRIVLAAGRRLSGTVRDTDGQTIAGARVNLWGADGSFPQSADSDREGRYAFASLPARLQYGTVGAYGYASRLGFEDASGWTDPHDVVLRRDQLLVDASDAATRAPLLDARGMILVGEPLQSAGVLHPAADHGAIGLPRTPGRLLLWVDGVRRAVRDDRLAGEVVLFAPGRRTARERVTWNASEEPPHLRVALESGDDEPSLAGVVVDGPQARIAAFDMPVGHGIAVDDVAQAVMTTTADAEGRFALRGLPAGRYRVRVDVPGRAAATADVFAPATDLRFEPWVPGALEVRVTGQGGSPAAGVSLVAEPDASDAAFEATSNADGLARFEGLPPGPVVVAPGRRGASVGWTWQHPGRVRAVVVSDETARAEIVLPSRVRHVLRVVDETGRGVEGATLRLRGMGYGSAEGEWERVLALRPTTDAEGRASADLFPGGYGVEVVLPWGAVLEPRLEVALRPTEEQVVVATRDAVTLRGRVLEEGTDVPIVGRPVTVGRRERGGGWIGRAVTDADGVFEIVGLPRAPVTLHAQLQSRGEDRGMDDSSPWPRAQVDIDLSRDAPDVALRVPRVRGPGAVAPTARVVARVRSATDDAPIVGANAGVWALRGAAWVFAGDARTDANGRLEAPILGGTRYRVVVAGPYAPKQPRWQYQEIEVDPSGDRVEVDVRLRRAP